MDYISPAFPTVFRKRTDSCILIVSLDLRLRDRDALLRIKTPNHHNQIREATKVKCGNYFGHVKYLQLYEWHIAVPKANLKNLCRSRNTELSKEAVWFVMPAVKVRSLDFNLLAGLAMCSHRRSRRARNLPPSQDNTITPPRQARLGYTSKASPYAHVDGTAHTTPPSASLSTPLPEPQNHPCSATDQGHKP